MNFHPQLKITTCYTFLQSNIKIADIINFAKKHNHQYVVLADFQNMYGAIEFYNLALKNNLIPIFGLQFQYKGENLLVIAKNNQGYNVLCQIASGKEIDENSFNDLVVIANNPDFSLAKNEVYYSNLDSEKGIYLRDNFFLKKDDFKTFCSLQAIRKKTLLEDELENYKDYTNYFLEQEDQIDESDIRVQNLFKILKQCSNVQPSKHQNILQFPLPNEYDKNDYLKSLAWHGLTNVRFKNQKVPQNYVNRLEYELKIIFEKNFSDYFLIVHDYISFAKKNGIFVGPGRGSVAGSLVAYALAITDVDPIKYDLYFERFLNPERLNMPDIDVDFMDIRREEVINYLYEKYSFENVAQIVTFQVMKARMAIRDVGRVLNINLKKIDYIAKNFANDFEGDLIEYAKNNKYLAGELETFPELFEITNKIVGLPRQSGLHAAGVVLSSIPLGYDIPIFKPTSGYTVTQYSMDYLEQLGLLKMDILGLRNLTTIYEIIKLIYKRTNKIIEIEKINLEDPSVYAEISQGKTTGIFQLESPGMTKLTTRLKPQNIEDLSLISALFRPGPQKHINYFLDCRHKNANPSLLLDSLKDILGSTYGIIIYQEQLIAVVVKVTNMSLSKADLFRRAISKKEATKLMDLKKEFIELGLKNNYKINVLEQIWDYIYEFANYGFNHSHSIAYSFISYRLAWLKKYYKTEFFCVLLSSFSKTHEYILEAKKEGIDVLKPNINFSKTDFALHDNKIYFGFKGIKGLGVEGIKKILQAQKKHNQPFANWKAAFKALIQENVTPKTMTLLIQAGCFDDLFDSPKVNRYFLEINLKNIYTNFSNLSETGEQYFDIPLIEQDFDDAKKEEYKKHEFELLGVQFNKEEDHFLTKIKQEHNWETDLSMINNQFKIYEDYLVIITYFKTTKTKYGKDMAWIQLEDNVTESVKLPYFGDKIELMQRCYNNKTPCIIQIEKKKEYTRIKDINLLVNNK